MKFALETKSRRADKPGPIDQKTGFPMHHSAFTVEADSEDEARRHFEKKYPDDVLDVVCID